MENASNALIIAGGVLIGVLLLSVIVVAFQGAADLAKSYDTSIASTSLQAFNNTFEKFQDSDVNIHDIITLAHFAKDYNTKNLLEKTDSIYITVKCESTAGKREELQDKTDSELLTFLEANTFSKLANGQENSEGNVQKYKCKDIQYNENTGVVTEITFEKVKENT